MHCYKHWCGVDVQDQLCDNYTLKMWNHKCPHWIMFHIINTTIANSYTMYKAHMTHLGKSTKTMSHLQFNVSLAKAFIKRHVGSTPKKNTMMARAFIVNHGGQHHFMQWTRTQGKKRLCVTCKKKVNC